MAVSSRSDSAQPNRSPSTPGSGDASEALQANPVVPDQAASTDSEGVEADGFDFEQFITEAEEKIIELKARRRKVSAARTQYDSLQAKIKGNQVVESIETSQAIADQLGQIELEMANELIDWVGDEHLTWKTPGENFWTFFRYSGIGFFAAIALHYLLS